MGVYEIDIYAKTLYGAPLFVTFQSTMAAEQRDYGALEVSWTTPIQSDASEILAGLKTWSRLRLVRNSYGVPETEDDGWVILEAAAGAGNGTGDPENRYLDNTVVPGRVYYYAVFVSTAPDAYSSTATYYSGDLVTYSGKVYMATATTAISGLQPDTNPTSWQLTGMTEAWYRCGGCVGLAVKDFNHSELLYDHIPRPYKVEVVESTASSIPVNDQLQRFCSLFGYYFDVMKCEHSQLLRMNSVLECTDRQLHLLAYEMGVSDRLPALPELRRTYVKNAALIARDRGSTDATTKMIKALTGWDADVLIGYNELHDTDEAAFTSPAYPAWQRDRVYYTTANSQLYSDIVSYNGSLYSAIGTPRRDSAYLSYVSGTNPTKTGNGTIIRDPDRVADPFPGYVRLSGAAVGDTLTFTFAAPSSGAGTYSVYLRAISDPNGGIITATVNGVNGGMTPVDLYGPDRQKVPLAYVGSFSLTATGNTLTITTTGKNALSSGYDITLSNVQMQGSALNLNVHPTGDATSATYWQLISPNSLKDTSTEWNPLTTGYGSWNLQNDTTGLMNPDVTSTSTPDWWISPQGAAVGTSSPGSGNSLNYTALGNAGSREVMQAGPIKASNWDPTNTYYPGQAVTWNPLGWGTAPVYVARAQSVNRQPDRNPDKWAFTPYKANLSPEPSRILADTIHTPAVPTWSSTRAYQKGDRVSLTGHLFEAARPSFGIRPTGYSTDNLWWRWCGLNIQRYTWSLYHNRSSTSSGEDVRLWVNWYNSSGTYGGIGYVNSTAPILFDRFETTPVYPQYNGTGAPAGYTMPPAGQQGLPIPWNYIRGSWANDRGVVHPTGWTATDTQTQKAGRALWFQRDWVYALPSVQTGVQVYATFMSPPDSSQAVMEHGILFRYIPNNSYWMASADRLTYNTITVSGGNVTAVTCTVVATWTPITYGQRMRVRTMYAGTIVVEARSWSGWTTLASVTDTRNETATGFGLIERVRP